MVTCAVPPYVDISMCCERSLHVDDPYMSCDVLVHHNHNLTSCSIL